VYTFEDLYKNFSVDLFASLKTYGQTELSYTLDYDAVKTFLGIRFNNLPTHSFSVNGSPLPVNPLILGQILTVEKIFLLTKRSQKLETLPPLL